MSSEIWSCVFGWVGTGVSKALCSLAMSDTTHPTTKRYIPEDVNRQPRRCENPKSHKAATFFC